jgi:hypothetical protein
MNCIKTVHTLCQNCAKMTLFQQQLILILFPVKINILNENSIPPENLTHFPKVNKLGI